MSIRVDPAMLSDLARDLGGSTGVLGQAKPSPEADAGPSSAALSATVAELMRADAGLAETTSKTADDLEANKATYSGTDADNADVLRGTAPP